MQTAQKRKQRVPQDPGSWPSFQKLGPSLISRDSVVLLTSSVLQTAFYCIKTLLVSLDSSYSYRTETLLFFSELMTSYICYSQCTFILLRASDGDCWILQIREFIKLPEEQEEFFLPQQGEETDVSGKVHLTWHVSKVDGSLWVSVLRLSPTRGEKWLLGAVHLTPFKVWCGMFYDKKGLISLPWLQGECCNSDGDIYNERKWILSKVSPHALALLLTNPFLLSLGSLQRLVSAKPREVVLPTDFSTAGNTTEIMPFKAHVPRHPNVQRFASNLIVWREGLSRGKEIKVLSSYPTSLWIKATGCFLLETWSQMCQLYPCLCTFSKISQRIKGSEVGFQSLDPEEQSSKLPLSCDKSSAASQGFFRSAL